MPNYYITASTSGDWDTSQAWSSMLDRTNNEARKRAFVLKMRTFKPTFIRGDILEYDGYQYVAENDSYIVEDSLQEYVDVRTLDEHSELICKNRTLLFRLYKKSPFRKTGLTMFLEKHKA